MKQLAALTLGLVFSVVPALGGDGCVSGTDCANACPLAKQANARLATGTEAFTVSATVRQDFIDAVLRNVEGI